MALGLLHWKTRVLHKKVFLDEWAPVKKPTSLGGREGENLRRRGTEKAPRPILVTASAACCERQAAGGFAFWPFGAGTSFRHLVELYAHGSQRQPHARTRTSGQVLP